MIRIISFGFRYGEPHDVDRIVDCRSLRNPHGYPSMRPLTGLDAEVQDFISKDRRYHQLLDLAQTGARDGDIIAIGCFGGRHRSVAVAEAVARELVRREFKVDLHHRELNIRKTL